MASTNSELYQGGRGGRACTRGRSRSVDSRRVDDLGRGRLLGRADRARTGCRRGQRDQRLDPRLADVHRLVRRRCADVPGRGRDRRPTFWILPFVAVSIFLVAGLPALAPWFFRRYGDRVFE